MCGKHNIHVYSDDYLLSEMENKRNEKKKRLGLPPINSFLRGYDEVVFFPLSFPTRILLSVRVRTAVAFAFVVVDFIGYIQLFLAFFVRVQVDEIILRPQQTFIGEVVIFS